MKDTFRGSQRVRATNPPILRIFESQGRSRFGLWIHLQLPSPSPPSEQDRLTEFLSYGHFISTSHISTIRFVFFKGRFTATCFHNKQTLSSWCFCPTCIGLFQALLFTRKSQEFKDVVYVTMKKSRPQSTVQSLVPHSLWPSRILDMIAGAWCRGEKIFILNLSIIAQTSWRRKKKVSSMTWEKTDIDHTQWQTWGFSVI